MSPQLSLSVSCGRTPASSMMATAAKHAPSAYDVAASISRVISSWVKIAIRFSSILSGGTFRAGFSAHHPRRTAVLNTPLRMSRALFRCRGVSNALRKYPAHSSGVILLTRLFASPLHRFIIRRVIYRKSDTVRFRLSLRSSNATSTARSKLTVFSRTRSAFAPATTHAIARFTLPRPATSAAFATSAASTTSTPVCRSTSLAAISSFLLGFVFIVVRIFNP